MPVQRRRQPDPPVKPARRSADRAGGEGGGLDDDRWPFSPLAGT